MKRKYVGNLSDILCSFDTFEKEEEKTLELQKSCITIENIQDLKKFWDLKPYIDNQKLDDINFLDFFVHKEFDCRDKKCSDCGYCRKIANKATIINKENAENVVKNLDFIKEKIIDIMKVDGE